MSLVVVVGSLAIAAAVPLFVFSAMSGRGVSRRVSHNLSAGLAVPGDLRQLVLSEPARDRIVAPALRFLARHGRRLTPAGMVASVERRLRLAGDPWSVEQFLAAKAALTAGATGAALVNFLAGPSLRAAVLVPAALAVGLLLPDSMLARKAQARQDLILRSLPDALDQLTICVEAGLGFDAALARLARTAQGPFGEEIRRTLQDVQLGIPRTEALHRMLDRSDVRALRQFVHAIGQAETYGMPIATVLRVQAVEQRQRRAVAAEERAQKMPVKLVFPLVLCILPSLFVVILGPAALRLVRGLG